MPALDVRTGVSNDADLSANPSANPSADPSVKRVADACPHAPDVAMSRPVTLRPLTDADVAGVVAMEQVACAHPLHAWSVDNYLSSLRAGYWTLACCEPASGRVVAVCVAMDGVDEVHLLNIAVAQDWHGRGLARTLLAELRQRCRQRGAAAVWLEVRPSNERARALYEREGFVEVGLRKRYYPAATGREDAVVMRCDIEPPEAPHALD